MARTTSGTTATTNKSAVRSSGTSTATSRSSKNGASTSKSNKAGESDEPQDSRFAAIPSASYRTSGDRDENKENDPRSHAEDQQEEEADESEDELPELSTLLDLGGGRKRPVPPEQKQQQQRMRKEVISAVLCEVGGTKKSEVTDKKTCVEDQEKSTTKKTLRRMWERNPSAAAPPSQQSSTRNSNSSITTTSGAGDSDNDENDSDKKLRRKTLVQKSSSPVKRLPRGPETSKRKNQKWLGGNSLSPETEPEPAAVERTLRENTSASSRNAFELPILPTTRRPPLLLKQKQQRSKLFSAAAATTAFSYSSAVSSTSGQNRDATAALTRRQRTLKLAHVDSLLLPLSSIQLGSPDIEEEGDVKSPLRSLPPPATMTKVRVLQTAQSRQRGQQTAGKHREKINASTSRSATAAAVSRFVIHEARCNDDYDDDEGGSGAGSEDDDDESTDLSGFIVRDDEELSIHLEDDDDNDDDDDKRGGEHDQKGRFEAESDPEFGARRRLGRQRTAALPPLLPFPIKTREPIAEEEEGGSVRRSTARAKEPVLLLQRTLFPDGGGGRRSRKLVRGGRDRQECGEDHQGDEEGFTTTSLHGLSSVGDNDAVRQETTMDVKRGALVAAVVDLTASPPKVDLDLMACTGGGSSPSKNKRKDAAGREKETRNPSAQDDNKIDEEEEEDSGAFLRFSSPPRRPCYHYHAPGKTEESPAKNSFAPPAPPTSHDSAIDGAESVMKRGEASIAMLPPPRTTTTTTPPTTPPASPSKLRSPVKLLSPSKYPTQIPRSPHRPSVDAFWSSDVVNEWNDQYSPKKAPLTKSPRKKDLLGRFYAWSDDEDEEEIEEDMDKDGEQNRTSSSPSPCSSPRKAISSPTKALQQQRKKASEEKKAAAAKRKDFETGRGNVASALLEELDRTVSGGKLAQLSCSTGGVKIVWSKNLRSTAGRANWRRTVTRAAEDQAPPPPPSSTAGTAAAAGGVEVQHYASIELAEKVIDSDERLVNTLAHEFCHLANFMVSGVKDQPHGASFKTWAKKVTSTLRKHPNKLYRAIEVTTKHNYVINHKYLWVCTGAAPSAARDFLAITDDDLGCGAEFGRHSKSIDPGKHRCGKCKGLLVQVRPKPRKADPQRTSPRKGTAGAGAGAVVSPFKKKKMYQEIGLDGASDQEKPLQGDAFKALEMEMQLLELSD